MKTTIISPLHYKRQYESSSEFESLEIAVSFQPYLEHIKELHKNEKTIKSTFYQFIIKTFRKYPELENPLALEAINQYPELLELLYATLSNDILSNENGQHWGLSMPLQPTMFYSTDALYELIDLENERVKKAAIIHNKISNNRESILYALIFEKLYQGCPAPRNEIYHGIFNDGTYLEKYFLINFDSRFIKIYTTETLPKIDIETFSLYLQTDEGLNELQRILPMNLFKIEGFTVLTFTDITTDYVVNHIKTLLSNRDIHNLEALYDDILQSLKTMLQSHDVEFGLLPFLNINKKFVFNEGIASHSIFIRTLKEDGAEEETYQESAVNYFKDPCLLFFDDITMQNGTEQIFLKWLKNKGIISFALLPVFSNNKLTGALEVYSHKKDALNKDILSKLDVILPQIGQMFQNNVSEFEAQIESIIKENFTSLQPSVQWKFNEVAWLYVKDRSCQKTQPDLQRIFFEHVYPLYGAIDIRNSTIERNAALQKDFQVQLTLLEQTLVGLEKKIKLDLLNELLFECRKWLDTFSAFINSGEENKLNAFLTNDVEPLLFHLKNNSSETEDLIDNYLRSTDESTGIAFENRRKLETSIVFINTIINNDLESMAKQLQQAYPFYFEKFRTDGIEYDIYIGQSIAPDKPFDLLYLKNTRLWQLKSMASIVRLCHAMTPQLPTHLETTQLIFAHSNAIDISFRNDERRFDVEGYNIRYQIIKKRIDKVHIKNTQERLTQPGKIAIIYFNQKEADEYAKYIKSLAAQNILLNDLEYLELENLQGVIGLKALRVGVCVSFDVFPSSPKGEPFGNS